ncbi:anti-phage-associated DUF1156 domain-containing protein [Mesorhizobium sp. M0199]|uniref:anti-phage-associated DUF1156 domain-containing protein n=1 Tax=Mesorhizobium sp. M0199 TaxID=2956911 RepID=UPI00333D1ECC
MKHTATPTASPAALSLADAPALIERLWPAQKLSAEAKKERKAGSGQTLTALGSYWKGRKPLVLVRACVLASLLPATDDLEADLRIFERLMAMDDLAFGIRDTATSVTDLAILAIESRKFQNAFVTSEGTPVEIYVESENPADHVATSRGFAWNPTVLLTERLRIKSELLAPLSYEERVGRSLRPEELGQEAYVHIWDDVNRHLGTNAYSHAELVDQLGLMRFGRCPRVADTFAGGGSIPFEAARIGCDATASDLNPIACTWGAFNVIGGTAEQRAEIDDLEREAALEVERRIRDLGFEEDSEGNRAKSFLYCLETHCPETDWTVPICQSWVISLKRRIIVELVPNSASRRFDFVVVTNASSDQIRKAALGTKQGEYLVYELNGETHRKAIKSIRGDFRREDGSTGNALRPWLNDDIRYRPDDVYRERLYCIQWITAETLHKRPQVTFFAAPSPEDERRENDVARYVGDHLHSWQNDGVLPDMLIQNGEKTSEPIRTRGWTHWHHLFSPRNLLVMGLMAEKLRQHPAGAIRIAHQANWNAKGCQWFRGFETVNHSFEDQSLKTKFDYAARSAFVFTHLLKDRSQTVAIGGSGCVINGPASSLAIDNDIYITDPPYADAVSYHEITEFFIAWLRRNPPAPFDAWTWDSRRPLAIKGEGEDFRREMVVAYKAMTQHMPDNGIQIVMFTHQSGSVWADLAQIFWGAGLQVQAAWYIATETTSEFKKGGYVQGTVILVLRKRLGSASGYEDEIVQDVRVEVAHQIDTLVGLNQSLKGSGRIENLFEDADLQMAGYAAALRVLTGYTKIDGKDMTIEALRPRRRGEVGVVERMIDYAVGVANEHMVPDGISPRLWQQLKGPERFYLKMIGLEAGGLAKLDNYQNFSRAFRVADYVPFMGSMKPNAARLKRAKDFGARSGFDIPEFGQGIVRAALFGIDALAREVDVEVIIEQLQDIVPDYFKRRANIIEIADYLAKQWGRDNEEGRHAGVLANLMRNERL